jgi:hypothetical protein
MNQDHINDIALIYGYYLYRNPDQEGLEYWRGKLASNEMTFIDVANAVKHSTEATNKAVIQEIAGLYKGLIGRSVDAEGLKFWVSAHQAGDSIHEIAAAIRNSSEGLTVNPLDSDHMSLIAGLYQNLFHREADTEGLQFWQSQLDQGIAFSDVAVQMADFANLRANQDGANLNASNLHDYLMIRDEYKSLVSKELITHFLKATASSNQIVGTEAADTLNGTAGDDYIYGKGAGDHLYGKDGSDYIDGGTGDDYIYGGPGEDTMLIGGDGADWIYGEESGANNIDGGEGKDRIYPGPQTTAGNSNVIQGGPGDDSIFYDATVWGNSNHRDSVDGGEGSNTLVIEHFGGESINFYPEWAAHIDTLWFSTMDSGMVGAFTLYLHQGTDVSRILGLTTGFLATTSNFKLMYDQTPFNSKPVHEFQAIEESYIHASPVDDVKHPGDWFSYKIGKDSTDGYLTYYDEVLSQPKTIELEGYYVYGSISNGNIIM